LSEAVAYQDPGTPQEISRRTFIANVSIGLGNVIGLVIAVPLLTSLLPSADASGQQWSAAGADDFAKFRASDQPVRINIAVKWQDGYLPPSESEQFVWGIKVPPEKEDAFKAARPDLFASSDGKVDYPIVTMSYVVFSSLCPHLGCKFNYDATLKRFLCPCHGSQFAADTGAHLEGPAPRGLDPLPLRAQSGKAEVTWIDYRPNVPSRIIVAYT
jgi:Rieske Fe-S protein